MKYTEFTDRKMRELLRYIDANGDLPKEGINDSLELLYLYRNLNYYTGIDVERAGLNGDLVVGQKVGDLLLTESGKRFAYSSDQLFSGNSTSKA